MRFLLISILFISLNGFSQTKTELIGTWQIIKIKNNTPSNISNCEGVTEYKLTFNSDNTYEFDAGPDYITTGKWKVIGNNITFYDSKLSNPSHGKVADHTYSFEINKDRVLIIDEYIFSELGGKTYYKKIE